MISYLLKCPGAVSVGKCHSLMVQQMVISGVGPGSMLAIDVMRSVPSLSTDDDIANSGWAGC